MSMWWLLAGPAALAAMEFGRYCGAVHERQWWMELTRRGYQGKVRGPDTADEALEYITERACERAEQTWRWMPHWLRRLMFADEAP